MIIYNVNHFFVILLRMEYIVLLVIRLDVYVYVSTVEVMRKMIMKQTYRDTFKRII